MKTKVIKPKKLKTRVTSISVGATYNLGNYENVRFDLSVEVGPGESATAAFQELRYIIASLRPTRQPDCADSFAAADKKLVEERSNWEKEHFQEWADRMAAFHSKKVRRSEAIAMLDTLGGNRQHRDAKQDWETEDDPMF